MTDVNSMIEILLANDEDFLKVRETLTRIGIASKKNNTLYQSCHILHKQGRYFLVHFKELFALDGKTTNFSGEDMARRNTIVNLLAEWDLVELKSPEKSQDPVALISTIKVLSYNEKSQWNLEPKYNIGRKK